MHAIAVTPGRQTRRCAALVLLALAGGWSGHAQTPDSNAAVDQSTPPASNDSASPASANEAQAGSYGRGPGSGNFPRNGNMEFGQPPPMPVYFPPLPPRLGAHVELPSLLESHKPAPTELAAFVNEPFYAPLGSRLVDDTLSARLRRKLDAYLATKLKLQNELRSRLADLATADADTRQRAYATLARTEDPQIDELEQIAQQLRADLVRGEFFQSNVDWNDSREWRLGATRFRSAVDAIAAQFQVMRSAAFYQDGLLPEQRRLLLEVSMELGEMPVRTEESGEIVPADAPTDNNPPLFFSPATSRVHLPVDLPEDLADKVATYEREKSQLKQELRDSVYHQDNAYFGFARTHALATLAQHQQPRIAALEGLAEQIRRGLAALPNQPRPPEPPAIPPALAARITAFLHNKLAVQKDLQLLLADARRTIDIQRVAYVKTPDGRYALNLSVGPFDRNSEKMTKLQENFAAFNRDAAGRNTVLEQDLRIIRRDIAEVIGAGAGPAGEKAVGRFLSECADTLQEREDWEHYRDYRTAVLEPGLSPQQRRLLFDAALVDLGLALPGIVRAPAESVLRQRIYYDSGAAPFSQHGVLSRGG